MYRLELIGINWNSEFADRETAGCVVRRLGGAEERRGAATQETGPFAEGPAVLLRSFRSGELDD